MRSAEVGKRYAKALFEIAVDNRTQEKVFADLRALSAVFTEQKDIAAFLTSPLVSTDDRVGALKKALGDRGVSKEVLDLVILMANKDRLGAFGEVANAFETEIDEANGVSRGTVRSATTLGPDERKRIETQVEKVLKKKVIMTYKVDPSVIGGLVAQVGSYTFDDSISAHLRRMNEELKRGTV